MRPKRFGLKMSANPDVFLVREDGEFLTLTVCLRHMHADAKPRRVNGVQYPMRRPPRDDEECPGLEQSGRMAAEFVPCLAAKAHQHFNRRMRMPVGCHSHIVFLHGDAFQPPNPDGAGMDDLAEIVECPRIHAINIT